MENSWEEISTAAAENRRELTLHGAEISKRIENEGLDESIYSLKSLNFLDISKTCLRELTSGIGNLANLTDLVLHNNELESIPPEIGGLQKLKFLDISNNKLTSLPDTIPNLSALQSFNASMNKLKAMPSVEKLLMLHILNIAHNELESLPDGIYNAELVHLSQIVANNNSISEFEAEISDLPHLNLLNLESNCLTSVPLELSECPKLKELNLKGNKFKDRRFGKLVEQCPTKSMLDYLATLLRKENADSKGKTKSKSKKKKGKKAEDDEVEKLKDSIEVLHFPAEDTGVYVRVTQGAMSVRQYIVCCVVKQIDLTKTQNSFKNFITLQTKLHDTTCVKRKVATIATHDLKLVKHPLTYDAKFPQLLLIKPLSKNKEVSGERLVRNLMKEAEDFRKEKKRNTLSGIHQYLELLRDKTQYPCLMDKEGVVISFPPITNSDVTKMSPTTTDLLVEVTSSTSLDICKKVMDELLIRMMEMDLGAVHSKSKDSSDEEEETSEAAAMATRTQKKLVVEQVKVTDMEGNLRVIYPSRTDLVTSDIKVIRHFD
ncbi:hypothetical protein FSP39_018200 [Pinctada imbricata]|uniref:B3/B4 tRNA-binding domain-containing protein n=1 Tax=Pinctada imbricata TaxID=66713 RepID=A0AA89BKS9_PINIB|nr:hypothetical protein FSP39_018200 [Pinctada imbricata]